MKIQPKYYVLGIILLLLFWSGGTYNRLIELEENVDTQWAQIDTQLQRRNDLVPNLVNVAKRYIAHEKELFSQIAEARTKIGSADSVNEKVKANNQMQSALSRLLVVVERYPDLKSNRNFLKLQDQLEGTENRIAVARKRYNDAVNGYNKTRRRFPGIIIGSLFGFEFRKEHFQAQESARQAPVVDLD